MFPFLLGKYLKVEWLDRMVDSYICFGKNKIGKEKFEEEVR